MSHSVASAKNWGRLQLAMLFLPEHLLSNLPRPETSHGVVVTVFDLVLVSVGGIRELPYNGLRKVFMPDN